MKQVLFFAILFSQVTSFATEPKVWLPSDLNQSMSESFSPAPYADLSTITTQRPLQISQCEMTDESSENVFRVKPNTLIVEKTDLYSFRLSFFVGTSVNMLCTVERPGLLTGRVSSWANKMKNASDESFAGMLALKGPIDSGLLSTEKLRREVLENMTEKFEELTGPISVEKIVFFDKDANQNDSYVVRKKLQRMMQAMDRQNLIDQFLMLLMLEHKISSAEYVVN